jgi:tripartite-type tricarboxylate transporter receptor subunit TctC
VTFYENLKFNFMSHIAPVAGIIRVPFVMEINPSILAKTVPEFIAYAKANPGKINMASGGIGTSIHIAGETLQDDGGRQSRSCEGIEEICCDFNAPRAQCPNSVPTSDKALG